MILSAIVPVWNGREFLARLLDSLESQTLPGSELLVVDNGSTDGAPDLARARGARVISMGRNAGFAAAVNRGIGEAKGDWIAVLNSDVELAPDYFSILTAADAPFATGKILSMRPGQSCATIDGTFDLVTRAGLAFRVGHGRPDGPRFGQPRPIFSPPWTAALFRAQLFRKIGLLDPAFESYLEDVDFGLRCARAGISGIYEPRAVARHYGSAALGRWHTEMVRLISRNQVLLLARHYPRETLMRHWWRILAGQLRWGAAAARRGAAWPWLIGKWQGARQFSAARAGSQVFGPEVLEQLLCANEGLIRKIDSDAPDSDAAHGAK